MDLCVESFSLVLVLPNFIHRMGWLGFNAAFMRYGAKWRSHRRVLQQILKPEASATFHTAQARKNQDLLYGLLTTPDDFINHYRT